jgi:hypothetical protein
MHRGLDGHLRARRALHRAHVLARDRDRVRTFLGRSEKVYTETWTRHPHEGVARVRDGAADQVRLAREAR